MDTPPVETLVSPVTLDEAADVQEVEAHVIEEKVDESPSPAIEKPLHTSPDISFASEVIQLVINLK